MAKGRLLAITALLLLGIPPGCDGVPGPPPVVAGADLGQGWDQGQRDGWYEGTQGSRLLPWTWAMALETTDDAGRFFDVANIVKYRFLPP